ncbi:MAG: biotin/lipoate A/B protein ligase family protein [Dehalococcoidia bacterium]|nr:biotin/lipoate A/B protein ligase family protein [Dehalococcoidia bacterium]
MAIDEAVATLHGRGVSPPTIRFYGWNPACLSIGYFQPIEREVEIEVCRAEGIDVVRRPTGGRAVLHDDELTYSLIAMEQEPRIAGGVTESYRKISAGILAGLTRLSVVADMAPGRGGQHDHLHSAACFDSASSYEVTVGGKKLVGSAQVRRGGVVLQHGSLLLSFDSNKLLSLLKLTVSDRSNLKDELDKKVTSMASIAGWRQEFSDVAEALRCGFEQALAILLAVGPLTNEEEDLANKLLADKYTRSEWNFRR